MRIIFIIAFVIIRVLFCGYTTKTINESKGYTGGFWMGVLLVELGILIAVFKKELPDAPPNSYRVVPVVDVLKKYHYPFVSPQVEPIDILKGNIYAEAEAGKANIVFFLIHSIFLLLWYGTILGAYLWYIMGYTIYWFFKYKLFKKGTAEDSVISAVNAQSIKDSVVGGIGGLKERAGSTASKLSQKTEGVKTGAAEKAALAKEKAGAAFAGLKGKASEFAAERKKAENNAAPSVDVSEEASITTTDANADEKALDTTISTSETISEVSESVSFDELYEKAMNTTDDEGISNEATVSEVGVEDGYNEETVNEVEAPVVASSVNPAPTPTITQQSAPSQYDYSEKKKSPVVFVLVGMIAVLLVGMGILGGMLLTKNKSNTSENKPSESTSNQTEATTSITTEPAVKSSDIEKAANVVFVDMDARGMDITGYYILSSDKTKNANLPNDNFDIDFFYSDITNFFEEADSYEWFVLAENGYVESAAIGDSWDNNAFGSNETLQSLFEQAMEKVYQYNDNNAGAAETTTEAVTTTTIPETTTEQIQDVTITPSDPYAAIKQEIMESVDNEYYSGKNSHIENAPADMRFYNMSERYNMNVSSPTIYTGPGTNYSKIDVYSDFFWVYGENSDWYYVQWGEGNGAFSHSCYGYMSKSSNNSGSKYTEFDTSAAGSDFEFYSGYFVGCKVATQSGTLNLRAAPSTTAEVIIQMPKDAYVQVLGNNADWDYLSYTDNGTTYYGYASREYIK